MQFESILIAAIHEAQRHYGPAPLVIRMSPEVHGAVSKGVIDGFDPTTGPVPPVNIRTLYGCDIEIRNDMVGIEVVPR